MTAHARPARPRGPGPDAQDPPIDWDQLGLPVSVVSTDGVLRRFNRHFKLLLGSASLQPAATGLDWLSCLDAESRASLFTALADRRASAGPLAWRGGRTAGARWFLLALRWRTELGECTLTWQDVTLLHLAERMARSQADQLRLVSNAAPLMMAYFDAESMRCLFANRPYAEVFGLDEASVVGRTLAEIVGDERAQLTDPALDELRRTLRPSVFEHELMAPPQASRRVQVSLVPHFAATSELDGVFVHMADITRQRDSERALSLSQARLDRFMRGSLEGMVFHDLGVIVDANPAVCALSGYRAHELIGRRVAEVVVAAAGQAAALPDAPRGADVAELSSGGPPVAGSGTERSLRHRDGHLVPVEWIDLETSADAGGLHLAVVRDLRARKAAQERAHYLAHHDALTGLPNRQAFMVQLEHLMRTAQTSGTALGLLFLDLDHFKRVNESVGHAAADAHLTTLAQRVSDNVRSTDRVARFGGDEFMVLLPGVRDSDDVAGVAHKLITALAQPIAIEGRPISVTPSIGVALYPRDASTPDDLIKHADTAMHVAKSRGRATFTVFEPAIAASAHDKLVLEGQLGHALAQGEFTLRYQPQVCAVTGRLSGVEALIRWHHPERGLLVPDEFIALAEQHRLMLPIGRWVLEEAAATARHWHAQGLPPMVMAVNLSALQFQAPDFMAGIEDLLARMPLAPGWLELEITERMLMDDLPAVRERLQLLRSRGVRISIDDFGTGYASLSHLKDLPIDRMKIDRSFVQALPADRACGAIAGAIIQLARGLGLSVVAEGVETAAQQQCLKALQCDQLQGLAISAPLTRADFEAWLTGWPEQARTLWPVQPGQRS